MMKTVSAVAAAVMLAGSVAAFTPAAHAEGGRIAAGVAGGLLGGMLLGGAIANANQPPPPPVYYREPAPVYVEEPAMACRPVTQQVWDGYQWVYQTRRVCRQVAPY
jgi:hypothetical protein